MRRPSLTNRILRGLNTLAHGSGANEILDGVAEYSDYAITHQEVSDAARAREWISDMVAWRKAKVAAARWLEKQKKETA